MASVLHLLLARVDVVPIGRGRGGHTTEPGDQGQGEGGDPDSVQDGAPDSWEIRLNMDLDNPDQNGNGIKDGDDIDNGYDPREKTKVKVEKTIKVSVEKQWLEYYFGDTKLEEFFVSTGKKSTPTPEGEFTIMDKVPIKHYAGNGYDYPNTKWNLHFTTTKYRYYIHGAYWHNKFGRRRFRRLRQCPLRQHGAAL